MLVHYDTVGESGIHPISGEYAIHPCRNRGKFGTRRHDARAFQQLG